MIFTLYRTLLAATACVTLFAGSVAYAALSVNAPTPITHEVTIQPIVVSNDDGTNTATFMGNVTQEAAIKGFVDVIFSQAGIDIVWLAENAWNDTFANVGTADPRPTADLGTMVSTGTTDGVTNADPTVINMFFVQNPAGFNTGLGTNTAAGLAYVGANGISQYVGSALPTFTGGQEVAASVISHEIVHNLGLAHTVNALDENLMNGSGTIPDEGVEFDGERLTSSQITTILGSQFAIPVPEPQSLAILGLGGLLLMQRRRRA